MNAINEFFKEQAQHNSVAWTNVLCGHQHITVDPSLYHVSMNTFRSQARKERFKTKLWNCDKVMIFRGNGGF